MASRDSIYNQILYNKNLYESGNAGQKAWASQNVKQYYNQLDASERSRIQAMNASQLKDYRSQMGEYNKQQQEQAQQPKPDYSPPVHRVDIDKYKTENATIEDISKKYGFDYSREYAQRQAEAEAQAKRDAIENQRRGVDLNVEGALESLDRNYYLQALNQQQGQVGAGINAGLASDQDLRMAMSRQASMGDVYRDANQERMRLADNLGRVDLERLAREDSLFNDRLQQGFENALAYTDSNRQNNQQMINALLQQREQDINQQQFGEDFALREGIATGNYVSTEARGLLEELQNLKRQTEAGWMGMTPAERQQAEDRGDALRDQLGLMGINVDKGWNASQMTQNMANNRVGQQTIDSQRIEQEDRFFNSLSATDQKRFEIELQRLEEEKRQYDSEAQWRKHTYENFSARERAEMDYKIETFGADLAWRYYQEEEAQRRFMAQMYSQQGAGQAYGSYNSSDFLIQ